MKKVFSVVAIISFVMLYACGGGSSDDPKAVMDDYFKVMDDFITGIDGAEDADSFVAVLEKIEGDMKDLVPRLKALKEKFPELNMASGKMPEEYKEYEEKFKELMPKMIGIGAKLRKFASDPKVIEAFTKFQKSMKDLMQ